MHRHEASRGRAEMATKVGANAATQVVMTAFTQGNEVVLDRMAEFVNELDR